jgi:serine/threonine-protein kinase
MYGSGVLLADRYQLDERIGSGGMGEVWRATDLVLGRTVAVKVMRPQLVAQPGFAQRFLAEARAMATVKHPAVVDIYDFQGDSSAAFLVMELVDGEPLSHRLQRIGRMRPAAAMALVAQTAEALQAAHDRGIVHRDVKPANLLVTSDERVVLTDFGIARSGASAQLTATGEVIGTPSYLAPEQVLGQQATPSSDMYALGVVAYECLTGRLPFGGDNSFAIATRRLHEPPPPMDADIPPGVVALVQRTMAAEPDERPARPANVRAMPRRGALEAAPNASVQVHLVLPRPQMKRVAGLEVVAFAEQRHDLAFPETQHHGRLRTGRLDRDDLPRQGGLIEHKILRPDAQLDLPSLDGTRDTVKRQSRAVLGMERP